MHTQHHPSSGWLQLTPAAFLSVPSTRVGAAPSLLRALTIDLLFVAGLISIGLKWEEQGVARPVWTSRTSTVFQVLAHLRSAFVHVIDLGTEYEPLPQAAQGGRQWLLSWTATADPQRSMIFPLTQDELNAIPCRPLDQTLGLPRDVT